MEYSLETLRDALDRVDYGIVLLDEHFDARFINQAFFRMWRLPPPSPGQIYAFVDLMHHGQKTGAYQIAPEHMAEYVDYRIEQVRRGDETPIQLRLADGRVLKYQCRCLPGGGRMLTYGDVTELVQAVERLEILSTIDELTQLKNRRAFCEALDSELERARRYQRPLAFLLLDADRFKHINDDYGHVAGDEVLRAIARCCQESIRSNDILGRLGGEEFALGLPETDSTAALSVAEKVRQRIAAAAIATPAGILTVTVSIGVAVLDASIRDFTELFSRADEALYLAKGNGRNRVQLSTAA